MRYAVDVPGIFTADLDMRITSCNPAVAAALGQTPEELIGTAFVALQTKTPGAVMRGYKIGLTAKSIQQVMKTTQPTEGEVLSHRVQSSLAPAPAPAAAPRR